VTLSAPLRIVVICAPALILLSVATRLAASDATAGAEGAAITRSQVPASAIVIGFVGGFVRHDNARHGPVQFAERMRSALGQGTYVRVFENRRRKQAYKAVTNLLDTNHDGVLSVDEKSRARIVLFGHSWGAAAAVLLAQDLEREHIPVLLTVQVDSVAKLWQKDAVIPANVTDAVNFYQPHGLIHGRARITAADPSHTQILGNYLVDYRKTPVTCGGGASWFDHLTPSHAQSECDPQVWSRVGELVRRTLTPSVNTASASLQP
jgi:Lipase (class 3)